MSPVRAAINPRRRHGGGGGGGTTYESVTNWARPAFTPTRSVPFTDRTSLSNAISGMQAGDYIYYAGTGVLTLSSSSGDAFTISGKNPSGKVVIDFGTRASVYGAPTTPNYVEFQCSATSNLDALYIINCSNLTIYGGSMTTMNSAGSGIYVVGPCTNLVMWDWYCYNLGGHGIFAAPSSTGAINNCSFRGEAVNWGQNLNLDPHAEKGTGLHGGLLADITNGGGFQNTVFAIYAHDSNAGNGIELGQSGGGPISGNTIYCKAVNLSKQATSQVAANTIALWGTINIGVTAGWLEGDNLQGRVVDGEGLNSAALVNAGKFTVSHGRHSNTNQNPHLSTTESGVAATQPYDDRWGITYNDCT